MARNYSQEQYDMMLADTLKSLGLELKADPMAINKKRYKEQEDMMLADATDRMIASDEAHAKLYKEQQAMMEEDIAKSAAKKVMQQQANLQMLDKALGGNKDDRIASALHAYGLEIKDEPSKEEKLSSALHAYGLEIKDEPKKTARKTTLEDALGAYGLEIRDEGVKNQKLYDEQKAMMEADKKGYIDTMIDDLVNGDDYLRPKKPNTTPDMYDTSLMERGVSYAGGLANEAIDPMQRLSARNGLMPDEAIDPMQRLSALGEIGSVGQMAQAANALGFGGFNPDNIQPEQNKLGLLAQYGMYAKDVFDKVTGVDEDAYVGKTLERYNKTQEALENVDPVGKAADINRAKMLSQLASQTDDVALKARYGAAIKRLLPRETQGLDDLTAANFATSSEKMEIERLKAATQLQKQYLANQNRLDVAGVNAGSRENVANINAESRRDVANINADVKKFVADMSYKGKIDVANLNNASREEIARMKASANLTADGVDFSTGDIIPSTGVVGAVQIMEENPGSFNTSAKMLDNDIGRLFGAVTGKTVENRAGVRIALQTVVTDSVMNLMKLFPKGGASVINSNSEQERFVPIAKKIDKGVAAEIIPALKSYYGDAYDKALNAEKAREGNNYVPPCTREEYVNLMMYGNTNGKRGGGRTYVSPKAQAVAEEEQYVTL